MKTIFFIRHAKAKKNLKIHDLQRNLSSKGKQNIKTMRNRLKTMDLRLDVFYSSPAKRGIKSAKKLSKAFNYNEKDIITNKILYLGDFDQILDFIKELKEDKVALLFHNPQILKLCEYLSHVDINTFPTCAIMCLEFDIDDFKDIKEHSARVVFFDYPKSEKF